MRGAPELKGSGAASYCKAWRSSGRHVTGGKIVLRRNTERIGHAIEESKKCGDVYGFGNLLLFPSGEAQLFDVFRRGTVSRVSNQFHILQESALCRSQLCFV
jgi:hypothetical protein